MNPDLIKKISNPFRRFPRRIDPLTFWRNRVIPEFSYTLEKTAVEYDQRRLTSNRGRYKHFAECRALSTLLGRNPGKIMEVGCGTGRITAELIKKGFQVTPTDPSEAMLKQFRKKKNLPEPIKADGTNLPFKDGQFETALAIRVIWHLPQKEAEKILSEMKRVSSQSVIFDIANKKRFLGRFLIGPNTWAVVLEDCLRNCREEGLEAEAVIPLDIGLPLWLNFFPRKLIERFYPSLYRMDLILAKFIPPARYLVKFKKATGTKPV